MDGRVVALRAVELLRVSLMELDAPKPPQGELPPYPTLRENSQLLPEVESFSLSAESSLLWSPGGCGPGFGAAAAAAWRPTWIGARFSGGSVLSPATLTVADAGAGEVITRWLAIEAIVQPRRTRIAWRPRGGLGVAALATSVRGAALAPRSSHQETVYTFSPIAFFDLGWAAHTHVRIHAGFAYLRPFHAVDILVAGKLVGSYGRDIILANLGLEVLLP